MEKREQILLVDDERIIRESLSAVLTKTGYSVASVASGEDALGSFVAHRPDLVLLDVMMPGLDGYSTCAEMRKLDRETPIVFLSALDSDIDQIRGLKAGADDYVPKASSEALLLARIEKALARADRFSAISAPTSMTKTEADIFRLLESERGRYFSYREIFDAICGAGYVADEGAIRVHVSHMRKKLPPGQVIESRRGIGYALC